MPGERRKSKDLFKQFIKLSEKIGVDKIALEIRHISLSQVNKFHIMLLISYQVC